MSVKRTMPDTPFDLRDQRSKKRTSEPQSSTSLGTINQAAAPGRSGHREQADAEAQSQPAPTSTAMVDLGKSMFHAPDLAPLVNAKYRSPSNLLSRIKHALQTDKNKFDPLARASTANYDFANIMSGLRKLSRRSVRLHQANQHVLRLAAWLPNMTRFTNQLDPQHNRRTPCPDYICNHGTEEESLPGANLETRDADGTIADLLGDVVVMGCVQMEELVYLKTFTDGDSASGFAFRHVVQYMLSLRRVVLQSPLKSTIKRPPMHVLPYPLYVTRPDTPVEAEYRFDQVRKGCAEMLSRFVDRRSGSRLPDSVRGPRSHEIITHVGYVIETDVFVPFYIVSDNGQLRAKLLRDCTQLQNALQKIFDEAILEVAQSDLQLRQTLMQFMGPISDLEFDARFPAKVCEVVCEVEKQIPQGDSWAVGLLMVDWMVVCGQKVSAQTWPFSAQMIGGEILTKKVRAGMSRHRASEFNYVQHCLGVAIHHACKGFFCED